MREQLLRAGQQSAVGALSVFIARELNQPLTAIVANAYAALRLLANGGNPDDIRGAVADIVAAASRASEVIGGMRSRFNSDVPHRHLMNVDEVVREVLAAVRPDLHRHGVSLRTDLRSGHRQVAGDRLQMQQVVLNLALNAVEAMSTVADQPRTLVVRSGIEDAAEIVVTVEDSGPGLEPEDVEQVFDLLFTMKPGRLGMGLWISRSIVEAHGGRLWAAAKPSGGAIFRFAVPGILPAPAPTPVK